MSKSRLYIVCLVCLPFLIMSCPDIVQATDLCEERVAIWEEGEGFENSYVQVYFHNMLPGHSRVASKARHRITYGISGHIVARELVGGPTTTNFVEAGDVYRLPQGSYEVLNVGNEDAVILEIASLLTPFDPDPPGPSAYAWSNTPSIIHLAPAKATVRHDDSQFHVVEVRLAGGEHLPKAWYLNGLVLPLNRHAVRITSGDSAADCQREVGSFYWRHAGAMQEVNVGTKEAVFLIFGLKPVARYTEYEP
jgi:hypothetical protein